MYLRKHRKKILNRYGDVMRRDEEYVGKRVARMDVEGRRRRGRQKIRWMDSVNVDLREKGQSGEQMHLTELCGGNLTHTSTSQRY